MISSETWCVIIALLVAFGLFVYMSKRQTIDEFSNYGPEYSTNNPEGAPWDISSPFYQNFWGYGVGWNNGWNGYGNAYNGFGW